MKYYMERPIYGRIPYAHVGSEADCECPLNHRSRGGLCMSVLPLAPELQRKFSGMFLPDFRRLHFLKWCVMIKNTTPYEKIVQETTSYRMEAFRCFECVIWDAHFIKKSHEKENLKEQTYKGEKEERNARRNYSKKYVRQRRGGHSKTIRKKDRKSVV